MLKTPAPYQHELEMVMLESLVPANHLLRKIDAAVDFEFIWTKVAHLYCADSGRPALDPVVMFKLLFIGYLFGARSKRQLMREVQVNVAYRWFAGFRLTDNVPDASTFSHNRRRRYTDADDKPTGFFYLDHRTVDAKHAIITDTHVTPASVHDSQPPLPTHTGAPRATAQPHTGAPPTA